MTASGYALYPQLYKRLAAQFLQLTIKCDRSLLLILFLKLLALGFFLSLLTNLFQGWAPKYRKNVFHDARCENVKY